MEREGDTDSDINGMEDSGTTRGTVGKISTQNNGQSDTELRVGMEFPTLEFAYEFYTRYGNIKGFSVRKSSSNFDRKTKEMIQKKYVCSPQEFKVEKFNVGGEISTKSLKRVRTRVCEAKMSIMKIESGAWVVKHFIDTHNHTLNSPLKLIEHHSQLPSRRTARKNLDSAFDDCENVHARSSTLANSTNEDGKVDPTLQKCQRKTRRGGTHGVDAVETRRTRRSMVTNAMDEDREVDIIAQKCQIFKETERKNNIGQEHVSIINYFQDKRALDELFYFVFEVNQVQTFGSVFWADGRSRTSYLHFGDVVLFDVSFKTSKLQLPFASFTGVNHNRQSVLFGCALLAYESEETFVWLFEQWLKCMFNKPPKVIITDHDLAMCTAIKRIFPGTRHRFCLWNITTEVLENIFHLRPCQSEFNIVYNDWIYGSKTISEFETKWVTLREKYKIDDESWLAKMYDQRFQWAPGYFNDTFCAGMTGTLQSESVSVNPFFDGYINASTSLEDFVNQYEKAVKFHRSEEDNEDLLAMNSKPMLYGQHPIEKQVASCYTRKIFEIFQKELKDSSDCGWDKVSNANDVTTYRVGFHVEERSQWVTVVYKKDGAGEIDASCSCAMFEREGILCKHILTIMKTKQLVKLPERYILSRWTVSARRGVVSDAGDGLATNGVTPLMSWSVRAKMNKIIEMARSSVDVYEMCDVAFDELLDKLDVIEKAKLKSLGEPDCQG